MGELLTIGGNLATIGGLLAVASGGGGTPNPDNTMSLKNVSGSTVTDYPLRFARTFAEGEIANYPQIVIDGTPITTQADVKTQWGDGSVQHCVLSAVVSSMTNNVAMEITFQNQASPNTTALTKAEMLAFDFDSVISKTVGGVTHTASARTMLNAGSYTVWCSGQIATTVIIADHSASAAYDMTWSSVPERPIFHATFWKDLNKVDVSAIGELANAEALGDLSVSSMSITKASASPTTAYTKSSFTLRLASRWIKRFWIGTAPATAVNLDHNLAYLKETGAFPNYDTSIVPLSSALTSVYSDWTGASKDLYDAGLWTISMPTTGGRPDIGPMPTWPGLWLYTGDYRMREVALGQADLAAAWPLHFRESITTKRLLRTDTALSGTGMGLPISATDRKTTSILSGYDYAFTLTGDQLKVIGTHGASGWDPDCAHQPDAFSAAYALTGDPFYLEEMQMWAATSVHYTNGAATGSASGRGPTGAEGGFSLYAIETRGIAWAFRNRCLAGFWSPDADPMKAYFDVMVADALAVMEGRWGVTTGTYNASTIWQWAYDWEDPDRPNAMHFIEKNSAMLWGQTVWMCNFVLFALGRAVELGYTNAQTLRDWLGAWHVGLATDPDMNNFQAGDYWMTTGPASNVLFYQNWSDVFNSSNALTPNKTYTDLQQEGGPFNSTTTDHHYALIAACASAYVTSLTNGATARAFLETNAYDLAVAAGDCFHTNPKWAIEPRT